MNNQPYYCPSCRSNRYKFKQVITYTQPFYKDAVTGEVVERMEPELVHEPEAVIQCQVCGFEGNELRFIKQAEREPRR
ncbi:hypothetical protein MJA45_12080 [Paenibacillus aurantius]|uniref:DNA alkylation repair protein n=1 Tax=Paenibacillus aurantius TaxID=2918900 RepID=A0AA96LI26_9BACL|nr:hypothetical protein [Paenibacillus aurantius]WJH33256.1 hypothetical protein N6H14_24495 [Paenibacillus sp. CC-CFT747]WNQ13718.1 hypothetical protein MJA45_12080 [Paenibacillus aurantius]